MSSPKTRPPDLEAGTTAHYEDPDYYRRTYGGRVHDIVFYVERCANGARVLELGCGNGRITLPLARSGKTVLGIDVSQTMLDDLERRLQNEPPDVRRRVTIRKGDMRRVTTKSRFDFVICPFNAFLHLYTRLDVEQFLASVTRCLAPNGTLIFDVSLPEAEELARKPEKLYRTRPFLYPGLGRVKYGERFDYDPLSQVLHVSMEFEPPKGEPFTTPLTHRQFYPQELEALLHYNGFAIAELLGDFDGAPSEASSTLVYVVRPSKRARKKTR